jgi:hypothetical protein
LDSAALPIAEPPIFTLIDRTQLFTTGVALGEVDPEAAFIRFPI